MVFPVIWQRADYTLVKEQKKYISKSYEHCDTDRDVVGWKTCIEKYFDDVAKCRYPWENKIPSGYVLVTKRIGIK